MIECTYCKWTGEENELHIKSAHGLKAVCPDCHSNKLKEKTQ